MTPFLPAPDSPLWKEWADQLNQSPFLSNWVDAWLSRETLKDMTTKVIPSAVTDGQQWYPVVTEQFINNPPMHNFYEVSFISKPEAVEMSEVMAHEIRESLRKSMELYLDTLMLNMRKPLPKYEFKIERDPEVDKMYERDMLLSFGRRWGIKW